MWSLCGVLRLTPHAETPINKGEGGMGESFLKNVADTDLGQLVPVTG